MRRFVMFSMAVCTVLAAAMPSFAAPKNVTVDVVAFQFVGSGHITTNPVDGVTPGSVVVPMGGTALSTPTVARGDTITFANHDLIQHTIKQANGSPVTFTVDLPAGATKSVTIGATWAKTTITYLCTLHTGMLGQFTIK